MATAVNERSAAVLAMRPDWLVVEALLGGTRAMRAAGQTYLPKFPNETPEAYAIRLNASVLFPAYARTIQTLVGKPFSKPITLGEDVPKQVADLLPDIDLQGRNIDAFAASVMFDAMGYGLAGILVEFPRSPADVRTQADERAQGLRPYWVQVKPQQILGWRADRVGGSWRLLQLRLLETVEEPDGEFGTELVEQVRVLEPGKWTTYRAVTTGRGGWGVYDSGVTTLPEIPFVPVYGWRMSFMIARPPLIEVAHMNVAHWQSASDQQNILHVARVPILAISGVNDDKFTLTVGSSSAIRLPEGGKLEYVEHSGAAIGAGADGIKALEDRMRQAGAELLVMPTAFAVTATQVLTENAVGMSILQAITQDYEDALDQALQITAEWMRLPQGGHVTIFNDYAAASLQEASAQLLLSTNQAGKLSDETLYREYQRRGIVSEDVTWADEQARLEAQGPALGTMRAEPAVPTTPTPTPPSTELVVPEPTITEVTPIPNAPDDGEGDGNMLGELTAMFDALRTDMATAGGARMTEIASAISAMSTAIQSLSIPAPTITVQAPTISVNVPEQPAPIVNIAPAAITVNTPDVSVAPPNVTVNPPSVNVTVQKGGDIKFTEDNEGNITGATVQ